jgi:hypothetical protein
MSTIRCDNFGPSAGGTTYSARGVSKAWVNFNGTGTIASRDSENVSSLTDNGTGDYTVNFTNAFGAADFSMSGVVHEDVAVSAGILRSDNFLVGSCEAFVARRSDGGLYDPTVVSTIIHGDLA